MAFAAEGPISPAEMAVIERNAIALGVSLDALMENAGRAVAEEAVRHLPSPPARVAVLAGTGNNGGDGTCAAHYLGQWGYAPEIWIVRAPAEIRSPAARRCFDRAALEFPVHVGVPRPVELGEFALVIDALLGTGQAGALRLPYRDAVHAAREAGAPILSVDEPTGLGADDALRPRWTVALHGLKTGMTAERCGELVVRAIGIPPEAQAFTGPGEFLRYPAPSGAGGHPRPGRVVVIGGGPFAGAPALAALAALRAGAERATVLAPLPAADRVQGFSPDLVVRAVGEDHFRPADLPTLEAGLAEMTVDAVVVGMGIGRAAPTVEAMGKLLPALVARFPTVIDADALDAFAGPLPEEADRHPVVLTPNLTEFARALGGEAFGSADERLEEARRRAAARRVTLLVKGEEDLVTDARRSARNRHHPRALAVGGAGDLLAGVVGALLAKGLPGVAAGRLASYWVGEAGYRAAARAGPGLTATDVLEELAPTLVAGLERVGRRADVETGPESG
ncbi:MAG TPA: NAD(P)H-hydrate dehydratase [Thermoplasmata archaeon]|nr:NAD(P)H-hydrate dehydratase [Thermoplasmata archaeon]